METRRVDGLWAHIHWLGVLGALGSYTAAAQRLGVSKAAMSQRIAELERAAGVPLVRRTTRSVRLTEAGQQLADSTRDAYAQIERELAQVKDLAAAPSGLLRLTAPVALGRQQIVPRLAGFLREVPEVRIELVLTDQLLSLAQEGFDLAIRHTARPPETHVAWTLCETRSCLVASADYLARRGRPAHPGELAADLGRHDCLSYARPGETPTWQFEATPTPGDERASAPLTVAIRGPFSANNSEALREAAIDGLGIALLPDFSAQAALRAGTLQALLPDWRPVGSFGESLFAIRPYSPYVPRAVHALVEFLRASLKDGFRP
ncbi:LysR family transcriptional regulator [Sphaerotilus mobilis]|uniref:LysR family transcriptional regulator n=1 Tax=Sphaerotilus mobilis TaxID=47994 RepID=A0A4Q7LDE6_9BURK|nr:LysR family transcriptional regulator [Sphaerotilus mobilis]RZS51941.1 LysR family transcriptional regulator [Sphaerotilus mobilis]